MTTSHSILACLPLLLCGCSDSPKSAAVPEAKKESLQPVSAQPAFHKMFVSARSWAADAQPLRVRQIDVDEVKPEGGNAGAWEALFVSQSQGKVRRYIFSVIHRPARNLRGGVNAEPEEEWTGRGDSGELRVGWEAVHRHPGRTGRERSGVAGLGVRVAVSCVTLAGAAHLLSVREVRPYGGRTQ